MKKLLQFIVEDKKDELISKKGKEAYDLLRYIADLDNSKVDTGSFKIPVEDFSYDIVNKLYQTMIILEVSKNTQSYNWIFGGLTKEDKYSEVDINPAWFEPHSLNYSKIAFT